MILKGKLLAYEMTVTLLSFTWPVGGISEYEVSTLAGIDDVLEVLAPDTCLSQVFPNCKQGREINGPPPILTSVSHIELPLKVVSPHALETSSVEEEHAGCSFD